MGRPKKFHREGILERAIPVFWRFGLSGTNVQLLEQATGVNKSGLYSEFESKNDLFVAALERYLKTGPAMRILERQPLGWANIQEFLLSSPSFAPDHAGCFAINSTREVAGIPPAAVQLITDFNTRRFEALRRNLAIEVPEGDVEAVSDLVWTYFAGICINANLENGRDAHRARVESFMDILKISTSRALAVPRNEGGSSGFGKS